MGGHQLGNRQFAGKTDVQHLHEAGYDKVGEWDLAQICRHLTITMDRSLNGFPFKGPWLVRKLIIPFFKKKFFQSRSIKPGLKAPPDMMMEPGQDEVEAVEQFKTMIDRVDQFRGPFQMHPFFDQLTNEEWRQFHLIHASHHFSFIAPRP